MSTHCHYPSYFLDIFLPKFHNMDFQTFFYLYSLSTVFGADCLFINFEILRFFFGIKVLMLTGTERKSIVNRNCLLCIRLCWYKVYTSPLLLVQFYHKVCHVYTQNLHRLHEKNQ